MPTAPTFFAEVEAGLVTFVRQSAWLNTIPEKQKKPRRETRGGALPPLAFGAYLIDILFEIGPIRPAGMGGTMPMDEQELRAWQDNQGITLTAWEARTLRMLAREYSAMLSDAADPTCPPPYVPVAYLDTDKRKKIAEAMSKWADGLNKQKAR